MGFAQDLLEDIEYEEKHPATTWIKRLINVEVIPGLLADLQIQEEVENELYIALQQDSWENYVLIVLKH